MVREIVNIIYPEKLICLGCEKEYFNEQGTSYFCEQCENQLIINRAKCSKCDRIVDDVYDQLQMYQYKCKACQEQFHYYKRHLSCTLYEGISKKIILDLKYKGKTENAKGIAERMHKRLLEENLVGEFDIIVPTPIHWTRRWMRGFNQSDLIAKALKERLASEIEIVELKRTKLTKKLKKLSRDSRKSMLKDAIILEQKKKKLIENKNVIIIDDIYTTGVTVDTCAKVLYEAGAEKIYCITFAMGH